MFSRALKPIIQCDVDSVLAEIDTEWLNFYNKDYNDNITKSMMTGWDMAKLVKPECGEKIFDYLWMDNFYDNVEPIKNSLAGVQILRQEGFRVVFVTSGVQPAKVKWLHRHGYLESKIPHFDPDVVIASDKTLIRGDILIDDRDLNCERFSGVAICYDQPWNQNYKGIRAYNWYDVVGKILGGVYEKDSASDGVSVAFV